MGSPRQAREDAWQHRDGVAMSEIEEAVRIEREAIAQMLKARAALHENGDGGHKRPCDEAVATVLREMAAKIVATKEAASPAPARLSEMLQDGLKMVRCKCGGLASSDEGYVHAANCLWMKRREANEPEEVVGVMTAAGDWFPSRSVARRSATLKGEPPPTFVPTAMKKEKA